MRKILASSVLALMLVGCGGGSGDPIATADNTGTSFYVDSAVSGVNYTCGAKQGITGADGSFTFDVGSGCTFYLGDVTLRTVDAGVLKDGQSVYETDLTIARILQSLDADGNVDNGIQINADIVKALAGQTLPTTSEQLDAFLKIIADEGGTVVSEIDASNHLKETELRTALSGKTLYFPDVDMYCQPEIETISFSSDMTSFYAPAEDGGTGETVKILKLEGYKIYLEDSTEVGIYQEILEITKDYIITTKGQDGTDPYVELRHKAYFNRPDAEAALGGYSCTSPTTTVPDPIVLPTDPTPVPVDPTLPTIDITQDMLTNKSFYTVRINADGISVFEEISFYYPDGTVYFREVHVAQDGSILSDYSDTIPYLIEAGVLVFDLGPEVANTYKLQTIEETQWNMIKSETNNSVSFSAWLLTKPSNYPAYPVTNLVPPSL